MKKKIKCGHGLVAEQLVANQLAGVRFSLAAQVRPSERTASLAWEIERPFLAQAGKAPGYVIADSPWPHHTLSSSNGYLPALAFASVVQRIEHKLPELKIGVRFFSGAQAMVGGGCKD